MPTTDVLGLPTLTDQQASAETTHNEALYRLSVLAAGKIIDRDLTSPPGSPSASDAYIVGSSATGAWSTHDNKIAYYYAGAWEFITPVEGLAMWVADEDVRVVWNSSAWCALGGKQTLTDGATINWNASLGAHATVTLGGNRTLAAPTNLVPGILYTIAVKQDATGMRLLTWNAIFDFAAGVAPVLTVTANAKDTVSFCYDGTTLIEVGRALNVS